MKYKVKQSLQIYLEDELNKESENGWWECSSCGDTFIPQSTEEKLERGAKDFAERFEPVMKELAEEAGKCECICERFSYPMYHVSDDPHSVEPQWTCPIHGLQKKYFLIHTEKQSYCKPCQENSLPQHKEDCKPSPEPIVNSIVNQSWQETVKLVNDFIDKYAGTGEWLIPKSARKKLTKDMSSRMESIRKEGMDFGFDLATRTNGVKKICEKARLAERNRLIEICEKMPTEYPEVESDDYDSGARRFKRDIINSLKE